jgi:hypothetical protein
LREVIFPSATYATVYPLTMILRIVVAQLLIYSWPSKGIMKVFVFIVMALCLLFFCRFQLLAQPQKKINHQTQSWFSLNNTIRLKNKFGLLADFHVRRNDFAAEPAFTWSEGFRLLV